MRIERMSNEQQDIKGAGKKAAPEPEGKLPDIDLLSLAEQRAASAPIEDFGVGGGI